MKKCLLVIFIALPTLFLTNCSDDDSITPSPNARAYLLSAIESSGVSGTATFIENSDGSVIIELQLTGTGSGQMHPAHIHFNTAAEGGGIAVSLTPVDGGSGFSTTTFTQLDDMTPITYADMIDFDGYINIHLSAADLGTIVAQGDVGQNQFTNNAISYPLAEVNSSGISGNVIFAERANGEILAAIELTGTVSGENHAAHVHNGSVSNPGGVAITLSNVSGETGKSFTEISKLDNDTVISFGQLATYLGYVNIHNSADANIIDAQGDIGDSSN